MRRRGLIPLAVLGGLLLAGASSAEAATTCTYSDLGPLGPPGNQLVVKTDNEVGFLAIYRVGQRIVIGASSFGPREESKDIACAGGTPTVDNVDRIVFSADPVSLTFLDIQAAALFPGASPDPDGHPEIKMNATFGLGFVGIVGSSGPDRFTAGREASGILGVNLDGDAEPDISIENGSLALIGRGGNDVLSARGGPGFVARARGTSLSGGPGRDTLLGGPGRDTLDGGSGNDRLLGYGGADTIFGGSGVNRIASGKGSDAVFAGPNPGSSVNCGPGRDLAGADPAARVRGCEEVLRTDKLSRFFDRIFRVSPHLREKLRRLKHEARRIKHLVPNT